VEGLFRGKRKKSGLERKGYSFLSGGRRGWQDAGEGSQAVRTVTSIAPSLRKILSLGPRGKRSFTGKGTGGWKKQSICGGGGGWANVRGGIELFISLGKGRHCVTERKMVLLFKERGDLEGKGKKVGEKGGWKCTKVVRGFCGGEGAVSVRPKRGLFGEFDRERRGCTKEGLD